jgi:hypothetical protein
LIGKQRSAFTVIAPGLWTSNEQAMLKRAGLWLPASDPDAAAYIAAVEAADGELLEDRVKSAINSFVVGCKADSIWTAIKASCILAGARTLTGALVPLVGAAPTNVGPFVSGDYNRKTGLVGNGSGGAGTKYLDSNRAHTTDPQNSFHVSAFVSTVGTFLIAGTGDSTGRSSLGEASVRLRSNTGSAAGATCSANTFTGGSRSSSTAVTRRVNGATVSESITSETPAAGNIFVFARNNSGTPDFYASHRLAFYSIGESLDLALLDTRVTTLVNDIAAAIP